MPWAQVFRSCSKPKGFSAVVARFHRACICLSGMSSECCASFNHFAPRFSNPTIGR